MPNTLVKPLKELDREIKSCYMFCEHVILNLTSIPDSFLAIKDAKESLEKDRKKLDDLKKYISYLDTRLQNFGQVTGDKSSFSLNDIMFSNVNEAYNETLKVLESMDKKGYGNKKCIDFFHPEKMADMRRYVV